MAEQSFDGPLHLQHFLRPCDAKLEETVRALTCHPVTLVRTLHCECTPNKLIDLAGRAARNTPALQAILRQRIIPPEERRDPCLLFSLQINEEDGVVHSNCQRCNRMLLLFDRTLYWGLKRDTNTPPETFPYRCACGVNNYEVALGFEYPGDAFDENDISMLMIVARCAGCGQIAAVLDDEAT
jgi:hypothetical protein